MAAYAQFGYGGYPSANQLLGAVGQTTAAAAGGIPASAASAAAAGTVPSPLSGANEASLSPSGGSTTTGVTTGPLSPGAISQASNNAGSVPVSMAGAAAGLGLGDSHADVVGIAGGAGAGGISVGGTSCCENGRPIMTDPVSGQTVCSCQYDSARLALSSYSRMPAASVGVYGTPYPSTEQNPYPSIGVDSSAFYSPLSNPYALKESGTASDMTAWTSAGLQPTTGYYSYDPTLAAYGYGASYDLASRRKNATRESTATLKAWLNEHKKNPYPTKGEKIMLAIITKMTLTQVSTWFANARRRLKKENKMTWEPKNKTEDEDDAMLSEDEKEKEPNETDKAGGIYGPGGLTTAEHHKDVHHIKSEHGKNDKEDDMLEEERKPENLATMRGLAGAYNASYAQQSGYNPYQQQGLPPPQQQQQHPSAYYQQQSSHGSLYAGGQPENLYDAPKNPLSRDCGIPIPATKPKIWSLADTVACKTPPPPATATYLGGPQQYYQQQQQQQQQHHLHHQQQQQMLQAGNLPPQQMQQPQPAHSSPLSMMSSYVAASPYSRIPTGFAGSSSSTNFSSSSMPPMAPTTPPMIHHAHQQQLQHHQQQQQQQQQQYHQQQQQRMGFPEIQPDTPPQTPPNMKLANGSSSSLVNPLLAAPTATPMNGMCYSNAGNALHPASYGSNISPRSVGGSCSGFAGNLAAAAARAEA